MVPSFFMCSITACDITPFDCGRRKLQASRPAGSCAGDSISCGVWFSNATLAMEMATGVATEPTIRSALSSVTKRLAFLAPAVGSVASSSTTTLRFSPAMDLGQSLISLAAGMPRPEAGPVSGRHTPMVMSARAAPLASRASAAATKVFCKVMKVSR